MTILEYLPCYQISIELHHICLSLQLLCSSVQENIYRILYNLIPMVLSIQSTFLKHWDSFLSHCSLALKLFGPKAELFIPLTTQQNCSPLNCSCLFDKDLLTHSNNSLDKRWHTFYLNIIIATKLHQESDQLAAHQPL